MRLSPFVYDDLPAVCLSIHFMKSFSTKWPSTLGTKKMLRMPGTTQCCYTFLLKIRVKAILKLVSNKFVILYCLTSKRSMILKCNTHILSIWKYFKGGRQKILVPITNMKNMQLIKIYTKEKC